MLRNRLTYLLFLLLSSLVLSAQEKERQDSLVRLLGCNELQQVEERGVSFRKALGDARFEHNSTLLLCDTALWNVNTNVINAFGNVKIIQNETVLESDKLDYFIDDNLAQFRGAVVQLQDKDRNILRTRNLDYNTKDSVATFIDGGAFRDKDGQIIESLQGSYDSKLKLFSFNRNVNMYTDSIFVKTEDLEFNTATSVAVFGKGTNAWKDDNMLSAEAGTYDRNSEIFLFHDNVHLLTEDQEAWSDSLKYYKLRNDVEMFGHVELLDTTRDVAAVAGYMYYIDSTSYILMTRDPAVIAISTQDEKRDTSYVGADTLYYWTLPKCDIPVSVVAEAENRLKTVNVDPVTEYRRKAAEEARAAAKEAENNKNSGDPNAAGARDRGASGAPARTGQSGAAAGRAGQAAGRNGAQGRVSAVGQAGALRRTPDADDYTSGGRVPGDGNNPDWTAYAGRRGQILPAPGDDMFTTSPPEYSFSGAPSLNQLRSSGKAGSAVSFSSGSLLSESPVTYSQVKDTTGKAVAVNQTAGAAETAAAKDSSAKAAAERTVQASKEVAGEGLPALRDSTESSHGEVGDEILSPEDSVQALSDSLSAPSDSLSVPADSTAKLDSLANINRDSTKVGFLVGKSNVKVFRRDMQVSCDSLAYTDLDSLIRLYRKPVVWNEIRRQYSADSITVIVKNQNIDRASLMSNAFIIVQEDSICYDQIKGAEMLAYFDSTGALKRFDAMGGASGLFYIEENDALATVNKFEAKMLTATFADGSLQDMNYFDQVKSDAYPVVQLKNEDKMLKGYEWQPERRPKDPTDITELTPRESQRAEYEVVPRADFKQTDIYFPGYMSSVYKLLAQQDSIKRVRQAERKRLQKLQEEEDRRIADSLKVAAAADSLKLASADSLKSASADSLSVSDSLKVSSADSLKSGNIAARDSVSASGARGDSLSAGTAASIASKDIERAKKNIARAKEKAQKQADREKKMALRDTLYAQKQRAKEAKWAAKDSIDAEKAKVREAKELEKKRQRTAKTLKSVEKREAKEQRVLERYKARFEKRKAKADARKSTLPSSRKQTGKPTLKPFSSSTNPDKEDAPDKPDKNENPAGTTEILPEKQELLRETGEVESMELPGITNPGS